MVREAEPGDLEDLNEASKKSWIQGFADILSDEDIELAEEKDDYVTRKKLEECIESDGIIMLVEERDGKVAGKGAIAWREDFIHGFVEPGEEAQIRSMYVHPDYWNQGIGSSILRELLNRLPVDRKLVKVEALENSRAVQFYRKKGFERSAQGVLRSDNTGIISRDYRTVILEKKI